AIARGVSARFSADGEHFVAARTDGTVAVYQTATLAEVAAFRPRESPPDRLACLPGGRRVVVLHAGRGIGLYDAATGRRTGLAGRYRRTSRPWRSRRTAARSRPAPARWGPSGCTTWRPGASAPPRRTGLAGTMTFSSSATAGC